MDGPRPLPLDRYATLAAQMDAGLSRAQVLEEAGITEEVWAATQETWLSRMLKQATSQRFALQKRYAEIFAEQRKLAVQRMREQRRKLEGPMPVPPEHKMSPLLVERTAPRPKQNGQQQLQAAPRPLSRQSSAAPPAPALPSQPRLTLEQLASFRAELFHATPADVPEIRGRFGLDERSHAHEDEVWTDRFQKDRGAFDRYVKLFQYFRSLLGPR